MTPDAAGNIKGAFFPRTYKRRSPNCWSVGDDALYDGTHGTIEAIDGDTVDLYLPELGWSARNVPFSKLRKPPTYGEGWPE